MFVAPVLVTPEPARTAINETFVPIGTAVWMVVWRGIGNGLLEGDVSSFLHAVKIVIDTIDRIDTSFNDLII